MLKVTTNDEEESVASRQGHGMIGDVDPMVRY
jgi:hypothetical protein